MLDNQKTLLEEKDGKFYFFNPQDFESGLSNLENLEKTYKRVGDLLREYGYPTTEEWQFAIVKEGSPALVRLVAEDSDENARRLRVQRYLLETWREVALSRIPEELKDELDKLPREVSRYSDGLPILEKDFSLKERVIILDSESIKKRLREALTVEVPERVLQESEKLKEIILSVRELEENGLSARELLKRYTGEYLAPDDYPSMEENSFLLSVFLRRHPTREQLLSSNPDYVRLVESSTRDLISRGLYGITTTPEV